jgi:RimJ/RimL family protein N-acetyltransferase
VLRGFDISDAPDVQRLAGEREVAATTFRIPHPYEDGMAEQWISTHRDLFDKGKVINLAITRRDDGCLVGCTGLAINSEFARAVIEYGFETLRLNRIEAHHFGSNPASGRVMRKIGLVNEGFLREHIKKWGVFEDIVMYGMLKADYEKSKLR